MATILMIGKGETTMQVTLNVLNLIALLKAHYPHDVLYNHYSLEGDVERYAEWLEDNAADNGIELIINEEPEPSTGAAFVTDTDEQKVIDWIPPLSDFNWWVGDSSVME